MHHPWIRPPDFWRNGAPLEPWEAETLDANQAMGINGDDGETFNAETQIAIGGDGMVITAPFRASDCRRLLLVPATPFQIASISISRYQPLERGTAEDPDDWHIASSGSSSRPQWRQAQTNATKVWIPLSLPVGSTLTEVRMSIRGAQAHSALPTSSFLPKLKIAIGNNYETDITPAIASTVTDSSATIGAYEVDHTVTRSGSHLVGADKRYWALVEGESGTDAKILMRLTAIRTTVTIDRLDPWLR